MPVSIESHDLSSRSDLDRRTLFDATQQVTRHGLRKTVRSNEQMNSAPSLRQEYRGLTGRVGTADDDDLVAVAELRFLHEGRVVVDADTFDLPEFGEGGLRVPGPCAMVKRPARTRRASPESPAEPFLSQVKLSGPFRVKKFGPNLRPLALAGSGRLRP